MGIGTNQDWQTTMCKHRGSAGIAFCLGLTLLCSCRPVPHDDSATTAAGVSASEAPIQPQAPVTVQATWILPGDFSPDTTLQELQQRYGAGNVKVQDIPGAEGESFRGVMLFPDDPARRATLYFEDEKNLRGLGMVSVDEASSQWKLASGIGIGTSLAEVQEKNGKPFTFSGFDWDYGGTIRDWKGGKLQPAADNAVSERMQLRMPESGVGDKDYPMGDSGFSSDDPRWGDLGITVGGISVGFPGEDDL
jgi:hypothetical protein